MSCDCKPDSVVGRIAVCGLLAALLPACASPAYYLHLLEGQRELLARRVPIARLLDDPAQSPELRRRLRQVQDARAYASAALGLPDNGSYTSYADLGRPYAVWNVFAAPEFSLAPRQWCHLLTGCVAYRGYFSRERAEALAAELRADGYDAYVGGVPAYSTLGWFDDPVVSSMLHWDDDALIGTLFHELAHQRLFAAGDTAFNESFASFVEREALRRFRESRGEPPPSPRSERIQRQFAELVLAARARLEALYAGGLPPDAMRRAKRAEIERLRRDYAGLREGWGGDARYDAWFAGEIDNAKLVSLGLYSAWVPAFAELFRREEGRWPQFYRAAGRLADLDAEARERALAALLPPAAAQAALSPGCRPLCGPPPGRGAPYALSPSVGPHMGLLWDEVRHTHLRSRPGRGSGSGRCRGAARRLPPARCAGH